MIRWRLLFMVILAGLAGACGNSEKSEKGTTAMGWNTLNGEAPLIIAHRGASGYRPEHTLAAYGLAIEQGADVIEPDLVMTRDGVLVARHDRYLSTTTDVADHPAFAARQRPDPAGGDDARTDWWVEDFTLAEIKTLKARQPFAGRSQEFDGLDDIPTFNEILALAQERAAAMGRPVGVYPETKHPAYFASIGLDFADPLLAALDGFEAGPVFIQSFEPEILKRLRPRTSAHLVQLVFEQTPGAGPNHALEDIAQYADGIGPDKALLLNQSGERFTPEYIREAHGLGLFVHPWTFRNDQPNPRLIDFIDRGVITGPDNPAPPHVADYVNPAIAERPDFELELYFSMGVDGVFTDFPDTAIAVRESQK